MEWWSYLVLVAFVSMVIAGVVADKRGADGAVGIAAGLLLGPIGIAVAFVLPFTAETESKRQTQIADALIANGTHRQCPACKEVARKSATRCPHCQSELPSK